MVFGGPCGLDSGIRSTRWLFGFGGAISPAFPSTSDPHRAGIPLNTRTFSDQFPKTTGRLAPELASKNQNCVHDHARGSHAERSIRELETIGRRGWRERQPGSGRDSHPRPRRGLAAPPRGPRVLVNPLIEGTLSETVQANPEVYQEFCGLAPGTFRTPRRGATGRPTAHPARRPQGFRAPSRPVDSSRIAKFSSAMTLPRKLVTARMIHMFPTTFKY